MAQGPTRKRGPKIHLTIVPFTLVQKQAGFTVLLPKKDNFNDMEYLKATLKPSDVPGLKQESPAMQLHFGYKKGGVGVVYEMPKQPGLNADKVFEGLLNSGAFQDRKYFKEWSIKAVPDANLLIAVSGTTPEVRDQLIKALGK